MSTAARRYYLRGRAALERGEADVACEVLASALDLAPHATDARLAYAVALCGLGDTPRAAQTLRAGLAHARTDPARAALWVQLGEVLTMSGDFVAAEDAFAQATLHPAWAARAASGRARVAAKTGRYSDAISRLLSAARGH
jgi:thioredoxin-like negative regulator of GroEL